MIRVKELSKIYTGGITALNSVSASVARGELCAVLGASGSGKSTLMNILGLLDTQTRGEYILDGERVAELSRADRCRLRGRKIGFVFQGFNLLSRRTALENVELPMVYAGISERRERALDALDRVGLSSRIAHLPCELSGGQQQRVAIARAIVLSPPLILADEPTGNLDGVSGGEVLDLLCRLNREGATVIIITHDTKVALRARRVITIDDGRIISDRSDTNGKTR